ncbi:MAG: DUF1405 domain-containing protein [archaeon]|jgi:uncharacterized membrane protein YpjA
MIDIIRNKFFLLILALINFAAGIYSFSYYLPQLQTNSFWSWILIADCPIFAILFGINLILILLDKRSELLSFISIIGNIKYGLWTIFVLIISGAAPANELIIFSHFLLILETIVLFDLFSFKVKHVLIAAVLFAINDFFDYVLGLHPFVKEGFLADAALFSLASTIILPFLVSILFSIREELPPKKEFQNPKKLIKSTKKWSAR